MKILYFILLLAFLSFFLVSCGDEDNPVGSGSANQIGLVWVGFDAYQNDTTIYADGVVMADPLPAFQYVQLGDTTYSNHEFYYYDFGYLWFEAGPIKTMLDPVNVIVKTSMGALSGSLPYPGDVTNVTFSATTIALGDTLTISFSHSSSLVGINAYCEWFDLQDNYHYLSMDTVVAGTSLQLTFPFIPQGGLFYVYSVYAMNGPAPVPGARANMSGDGLGFMVYLGEYTNVGQGVTIGSGYLSPRPSESIMSKEERKRRLQKKIAEMYGFSLD